MEVDVSTIADLKKNIQKKYYPDGLPDFNFFKVGDRVKVISPCVDFHFWDYDTGIVINNKGRYLGITVKFDKDIRYQDGGKIESFSFNPEDLFKINQNSYEKFSYKKNELF